MLMNSAVFSLETPTMTNVYNLLRETCGISQAEAAEFVHESRLDSVKSWCSDRRPAPVGVVRELKDLAKAINAAGISHAAYLQSLKDSQSFQIGIPHDERDSRHCGFPSLGAAMRAVSVAILNLPDGAEIQIVPRVRGERPINLKPQIVDAAIAANKAGKTLTRFFGPQAKQGKDAKVHLVIDEFKLAGGDLSRLLVFYRDEFDEPHDVGFRVLEKALLNPESKNSSV